MASPIDDFALQKDGVFTIFAACSPYLPHTLHCTALKRLYWIPVTKLRSMAYCSFRSFCAWNTLCQISFVDAQGPVFHFAFGASNRSSVYSCTLAQEHQWLELKQTQRDLHGMDSEHCEQHFGYEVRRIDWHQEAKPYGQFMSWKVWKRNI